MGDPSDDTAADDLSPASTEASPSPADEPDTTAEASTPPADEPDSEPCDEPDSEPCDEPDTEPCDEPTRTVAATAGIDEEVLDVSRDLASTVRLQWSIRWTIGAAVVGAVAAGITYLVSSLLTDLSEGMWAPETVGAAVFALIVVLGAVRAVLLYRSWTYVVRSDSLYLSRGVFTRVRTVVPYVRVQHVDTRRSPLERLLGLSTLVVYTAGSRGADVRIPGLTPDGASTLQRRLERLAIESEEVEAV